MAMPLPSISAIISTPMLDFLIECGDESMSWATCGSPTASTGIGPNQLRYVEPQRFISSSTTLRPPAMRGDKCLQIDDCLVRRLITLIPPKSGQRS